MASPHGTATLAAGIQPLLDFGGAPASRLQVQAESHLLFRRHAFYGRRPRKLVPLIEKKGLYRDQIAPMAMASGRVMLTCMGEGVLDRDVLNQIVNLALDWHRAGTVTDATLGVIAELGSEGFDRTAETATGRSTLLLSHLSRQHLVFTIDIGDSLSRVQSSPILRSGNVQFIVGPSQATLPNHALPEQLDLVFIDGPHGYPFPELEYYFFYPQIRPGGFLIVDDIQIPTIRRMFRILRKDQMWELIRVSDNTAFFKRTHAPTANPLGDGWWEQGYNKPTPFKRLVNAAKANAPQEVKSVCKKIANRLRHLPG